MNVFSQNLERVEGRKAWLNNLHLARLAADNIKSIIGPKGNYKIITYNRGPEQVVKITKDAVDIIEELGIQYPAIKLISESAKIHREETGDGVSSFIILLSGLLKESEQILSKEIHPNIIIKGYREAAKKALEIIDNISVDTDNHFTEEIWKIIDCGRGLITEKITQHLIKALNLATKNNELDSKKIRIMKKKGTSTTESILIRDIIINKEKSHPSMSDQIDRPKIAIINKRIGIKPIEIKMKGHGPFPMKLNIQDPLQIKKFKTEENKLNMQIIEKIKSVGANVLMCTQIISEDINELLAKEGIFALMSLEQEDIVAISEATGANIVGDINDLSKTDLGKANELELTKTDSEKTTILRGCHGITMLIRGNTPQILEELEKLIRRGITVTKNTMKNKKTVPGGGAIEMHISKELKRYSLKFSGKEQLAIYSFADALEEIPRCLSQNNGLNSLDTIINLNTFHANGFNSFGIGKDGCYDMLHLEVKDLSQTKKSIITRAYDVATMMLKINDFITVKNTTKIHK